MEKIIKFTWITFAVVTCACFSTAVSLAISVIVLSMTKEAEVKNVTTIFILFCTSYFGIGILLLFYKQHQVLQKLNER